MDINKTIPDEIIPGDTMPKEVICAHCGKRTRKFIRIDNCGKNKDKQLFFCNKFCAYEDDQTNLSIYEIENELWSNYGNKSKQPN